MQAADAALADRRRLIVAEVAQTFFAALGARERIAITEQNLANLQESERIADALAEAGRGTELDLARARSLRLSVASSLALQRAELVRQELRLATLTTAPVSDVRAQLLQAIRDSRVAETRCGGFEIGDRCVRNLSDAENYLRAGPMASYATHGHGLNAMVLRDRNICIGMSGILRRETLPGPDLGYALLTEFIGTGFAEEAACAAFVHAHKVLQFPELLAIVPPDNLA